MRRKPPDDCDALPHVRGVGIDQAEIGVCGLQLGEYCTHAAPPHFKGENPQYLDTVRFDSRDLRGAEAESSRLPSTCSRVVWKRPMTMSDSVDRVPVPPRTEAIKQLLTERGPT